MQWTRTERRTTGRKRRRAERHDELPVVAPFARCSDTKASERQSVEKVLRTNDTEDNNHCTVQLVARPSTRQQQLTYVTHLHRCEASEIATAVRPNIELDNDLVAG